jgi:putative aldouronate transport system substrate-binding protein
MHYLYSEEGQRTTQFGVEGVTYDMVNGKVKWTQDYLNLLENDPDRHNRTLGDGGGMWWLENQAYYYSIYPGPATVPEQIFYDIQKYFAPYTYYEMAYQNVRPPGGTDERAMDAEIRTYWTGQMPKMMMASSEEEVERIWRESIAHIDSLGADKVYEVANMRFQENKRKLGMDFEWPGNRP